MTWRNAGWYGADRKLLPALGTTWQRGDTVDLRPPPLRHERAHAGANSPEEGRPAITHAQTVAGVDLDGAVAANGDGRRPEVVLDARGVTKSYVAGLWPRRRSLRVLRGADLELRAGETVGLVGENGSGKSTLMMILVGSLPRDGGTVMREGSLGYCPQEPVLYERLTCDEHFELFGEAYGMTRTEIERSRDELYDVLGCGRWAGAQVLELSGGTRAKLNLGLALLPDPQLLLLDEPYAGFDWDTYQRFWEVTRVRREAGRSLLIISHFITDEDRFDRIYDLRDGRTVPR